MLSAALERVCPVRPLPRLPMGRASRSSMTARGQFTPSKQGTSLADVTIHATLRRLSVEGDCLQTGRLAILFAEHGYPSLFAFQTDFIYKILRAPTRIEADATPTFTLLPRAFLVGRYFNDPTGSGGPICNGPILLEVLLTLSASLLFEFTLTQWLASTIYEDKSA